MNIKLPKDPVIGYTVEYWMADSILNSVEHVKLIWTKLDGLGGWYKIKDNDVNPFPISYTWRGLNDFFKHPRLKVTELEALEDLLEDQKKELKQREYKVKELSARVKGLKEKIKTIKNK